MDRPKRILIAPDKFKGSLSAPTICEILRKGLRKHLPSAWSVEAIPVADGGEGTVDAVVSALGGEIRRDTVSDPLGRPVEAEWGWIEADAGRLATAVIEMSAASGLDLLDHEERNPMETTTKGTGQLIKLALEAGAEEILLGIGGSATVDGGAGMARALGYSVVNEDGKPIPPGGGGLVNAHEIRTDSVDPALSDCEIRVACDVDNPLLGDEGAARVYGPQKGASETQVDHLEQGLTHWADLVERATGDSFRQLAGTGAAGGLGFGLVALFDARLEPGAHLVMDCLQIDKAFERAGWVITGEGQIDRQTAFGKTPRAVAERARQQGVAHIVAVAGRLGSGYQQAYEFLDAILALPSGPISETESINQAENLLRSRAQDLARWIRVVEMSDSDRIEPSGESPSGEDLK